MYLTKARINDIILLYIRKGIDNMNKKLVNKIKSDSIEALKSGNKEKLTALRMLIAELEKEKVSHKLTEVSGLTDEQALEVIARQIKKLDKEIEAYLNVNRDVSNQEREKELLISYLPAQLSVAEITDIVMEVVTRIKSSKASLGEAMKELSARLKGKADMKVVSEITRDVFKNG